MRQFDALNRRIAGINGGEDAVIEEGCRRVVGERGDSAGLNIRDQAGSPSAPDLQPHLRHDQCVRHPACGAAARRCPAWLLPQHGR
ncbi:hypothetical protein ETR_19743 [Erwinia tracheiphila PSU-1]|nr:hypothetical protein ETR_19743 [Erwinia tracheiphila PSU-1]